MLPSSCGLYRVFIAKKYLDLTVDDHLKSMSPSSITDVLNIDDTISQFDLVMDDLGDCRISRENEIVANDDQLFELALYIQKNSRLKLIILGDSKNEKEFKLDNVIKIVRFFS